MIGENKDINNLIISRLNGENLINGFQLNQLIKNRENYYIIIVANATIIWYD
ncbi:MAG: hypothetical protein PWR10_2365 [Halanaerobiales bacterium]|nr:hypothetical protein [Halanaerobiales bacterium]